MKYVIRKNIFVITLLMLIFVSGFSLICSAEQSYPTRPVTIIVAREPGGSLDIAARTIQPYLQEVLGVPVVIENLPGASGLMGVAEFLKREADCYTMIFHNPSALALQFLLLEDVPYEMEQFASVIGVFSDPRFFYVHKDSPYKTVEDLIKDIRKRPNEISLTYSAGGTGQFFSAWFKEVFNLPVNLVGHSGGGSATTALIGKHVDAYIDGGQGRVPYREEIKAIGIALPERSKVWPEATPIYDLDIFKEEDIGYIPGPEVANLNPILVRTEAKEEYPERFYRLISAFYEVSKNEEFKDKAAKSGLADILIWLPPNKVDEVMFKAFEVMSANTDVLNQMME